MRFTFALVALTATAVTAQLSTIVAKIPSCALTCLATSAAGAGCSPTDWACQCEKRAVLTASATPCVLAGCTTDEALGTLGVINELCEAVAAAAPVVSSSSAAPVVATSTTSTTAAGTTTTTAPGTTSKAATSTTSATVSGSFGSSIVKPTSTFTPIQVPTGAASRLQFGVSVIGGALLAAMAL